MRDTCTFRAAWIRADHSKTIDEVLAEFPRLLTPGMIAQDFAILHGEAAPKLFENWVPLYADKIINLAKREGKLTNADEQRARDAKGEVALAQLPTMLPPPVYKKGRRLVRASIDESRRAFMDVQPMDVISRPELFDFQGIWLTHYYADNWENLQNFQARPDDILLTSYPKAGSTWVTHILDLLHGGSTSMPLFVKVILLEICMPRVPGLGVCPPVLKGTELVDRLTHSPRIIKTHLPVQFVPKSFWEQNCKMVYVARNAKDSVVSYFHFERMTMIHPEPEDWSSYLQRFMEGKMVYGSWYDHVSGFWEKKHSYPNLHYMFYEDVIKDTGREIDKLCCFLGLSPSAEEKEEILRRVQFDEMKKNDMVNHSTFCVMDFTKSSFMRKGRVGDWKNHFTVTQSEEFDEDYKKKMKNPTLQFCTEA